MTPARALAMTVLAALLPIGCGGGDFEGSGVAEEERADPLPRPDEAEVRTRLAESVSNRGVGYSLRVPAGWRPPGENATSTFRGGGQGCFVLPAVPLPDISESGNLLGYVRGKAEEAQDPGGPVVDVQEVRPEEGADVPGASVLYKEGPDSTRVAVFANARGGVTLTCTKQDEEEFERLDEKVLPLVYRSVRLVQDDELEELQPQVAQINGVSGAALRRQRTAVLVEIEVQRAGDGERALEEAITVVARGLRRTDVAGNASAADDQGWFGFGCFDAKRRRGFVQGPGGARREFSLGG